MEFVITIFIFILIWVFKLAWLALTGFLVINPYKFWVVFESWKAKKEPSRAYFLFARVFGIIAFLLGLIMFIFE